MRNTRETSSGAGYWEDHTGESTDLCSELETTRPTALTQRNGWTSQLRQTIESEIIPRLMMAHRANGARPQLLCAPIVIEGKTVQEFATLVVEQELEVLRAYINALVEEGQSLESLFLELLAPAARHLGEQWKQDTRDFADVTLGLSRLQRLLQEYGRQLECDNDAAIQAGRALLVATEGEQHTFGLSILTEFFRRDGWDVTSKTLSAGNEIASEVRTGRYDIVGFSVSQDSMLGRVASCIEMVRKESGQRRIHIMVGGRVFLDNPALVSEVGADSTASDASRAVARARVYLSYHAEKGDRRLA